ncbi:FxsB family cyclophane-forming radical SAM/SPASM peptide maturase [Streptomyces sp. NPDC059524]|uniref:FxsB family cyclophane-forming radical SAM/SPASM peptide maturase n=1 Tax=Streptomyces sp. NPDC059524 TaxID=3346856 RepID=UPI0036A6FBDD
MSTGEPSAAPTDLLAPWPLQDLDVPALRRSGVRPVPFRQFVLKVHSRCNLACSYCYIYEGADTSWQDRPAQVADETVRRTAERIAEHARTHRLPYVRIDLHGGEPLLGGPAPLVRYAAAVRRAVPADCQVDVGVQTNGTLLTESALDALAAAGIRVGLSLDGGTAAHNRLRTFRGGRSSWPAASRAARLLARRPETFAGVLCTIDLANDPADVLRSLLELRPPGLDLLLPHNNWSIPPAGVAPADPGALGFPHRRPAPYGDWLADAFDLWWANPGPAVRIRLFAEIIALLLGQPSATEVVGLSPVAAVVVDTDGAIEQVDSLKTTYEGAPVTGLDVHRHSFDEALDHPGIAARHLGRDALGRECRACPLVDVCGGGNYAHRFLTRSGFRHPTVYCADMARLIRHISARVQAEIGTSP